MAPYGSVSIGEGGFETVQEKSEGIPVKENRTAGKLKSHRVIKLLKV